MRKNNDFIAIDLVVCLLLSCSSCKDKNNISSIEQNSSVAESSVSNSIKLMEFQIVPVTPSQVLNYYKSVDYGDAGNMSDSYIKHYFSSQPTGKPTRFEWRYDTGIKVNNVKLLISDNADMSFPIEYDVLKDNTYYNVNNLCTNHEYYWQVKANQENGDMICSKISHFQTTPGRRIIVLEGVPNARDLGGIKTKNGKELKQGLIYRSGEFDMPESAITEKGINEALGVLGIKTELDLREIEQLGSSASGNSILGKEVKYINLSSSQYGGFIKCQQGNEGNIIKVFADYNNYPILFHCIYGADRTGTVAYLLEALCGAEENELIKDYELTFARDKTYSGFVKLEAEIASTLKGNSLSDKIYNFFYEHLKLSKMEISNIKNILTSDSAVFKSDSLEKPFSVSRGYAEFHIDFRKSGKIKQIKNGESSLEFETTTDGVKIMAAKGIENGVIVFDDGGILEFNI